MRDLVGHARTKVVAEFESSPECRSAVRSVPWLIGSLGLRYVRVVRTGRLRCSAVQEAINLLQKSSVWCCVGRDWAVKTSARFLKLIRRAMCDVYFYCFFGLVKKCLSVGYFAGLNSASF